MSWPPRKNAWCFDRNDKRPAMIRLLQDRLGKNNDMVCIAYHQQWRTFWKAQGLGYVEDTGNHPEKITQEGIDFISAWEINHT